MTIGEFVVSHLWHGLGLAALLVCSGYFSGTETAMFSLSASQILRFRRSQNRLERLVAYLAERPRRVLLTILLGNQLVNVAFLAVCAALTLDLDKLPDVPGWATGVMIFGPLLLLILLGEVGPKSMAYANTERFALIAAPIMAVLIRVAWLINKAFDLVLIEPLTRLLSPHRRGDTRLTTEELGRLMELSRRRRHIAPNESQWLREVLELGQIRVEDIMVPRVDIVAYDIDQPIEGLVDLFRTTGLIKLPVYRGDLDQTLGLIYAKDLLMGPPRALEELIRPVLYVPEAATVDKLLDQFRRRRCQVALAVDEYGGTAGLVTLEDALEEIVGDIDAPDEEPTEPIRMVGPGTYVLDGDLPIHEWSDVFGLEVASPRVSTIGGLLMSKLDRVARPGDRVRVGHLELTVEAMRRHRIARVRVHLIEPGQQPGGDV